MNEELIKDAGASLIERQRARRIRTRQTVADQRQYLNRSGMVLDSLNRARWSRLGENHHEAMRYAERARDPGFMDVLSRVIGQKTARDFLGRYRRMQLLTQYQRRSKALVGRNKKEEELHFAFAFKILEEIKQAVRMQEINEKRERALLHTKDILERFNATYPQFGSDISLNLTAPSPETKQRCANALADFLMSSMGTIPDAPKIEDDFSEAARYQRSIRLFGVKPSAVLEQHFQNGRVR